MSSFKVGDWITLSGSKPWRATAHDVCIFKGVEDEDVKLWQPKGGEWVVVYDKEDKSFFGVVKYDEEVKETLKDSLNNFSIVEPFIGELPSFLKDVK